MRGQPLDLIGQRFGRLTVVHLIGSTGSGRLWECLCDCGEVRQIRTGKLRSGDHVSCGCLRDERLQEQRESCRVPIVGGKKRCSKCGDYKKIDEFHKSVKTTSGLQTHCKRCHASYDWWKKFGITMGEADALLATQGGHCAVCPETEGLELDHDHLTNVVRGFLCGNHNRALGLVKDDPVVLAQLIEYLRNNHELRRVSNGGV